MDSLFTTEFFVGNRARLRELFTGTAPIVITANGVLQRGGDNTFPFVQDANFWYLTGIDEPDVILVMDKDKEYLIVPPRDAAETAFNGAVNEEQLQQRSGVQQVLLEEAGWALLGGRLKKVKHVASIAAPPPYLKRFAMYTNPARARLIRKIKTHNDEIEVLDLSLHIVRLRMIKQAPELAALQQAIDITIDSLKTLTKPARLQKYENEYELEADLTRSFRRKGAAGHAFDPIVAAGSNAVQIHHMDNNSPLKPSDLLVMDVGAEVDHYAADITRTFSLNGTPSRRQQAVHAAVLDTQQYAFGLLKPGVMIRDYELAVEQYMGEKLRELGLIKTIDRESVRTFFPHATSHFLGLNVHDAGDYERPLEPGNVLTVEPGIYIPAEGIGVRIEDDVLITEDGIKILSDRLPRTLV